MIPAFPIIVDIDLLTMTVEESETVRNSLPGLDIEFYDAQEVPYARQPINAAKVSINSLNEALQLAKWYSCRDITELEFIPDEDAHDKNVWGLEFRSETVATFF